MRVNEQHYRTIWLSTEDPTIVKIIDQRHLPHHFVLEDITSVQEMCVAIKDMHVRGAGLIGAAASYGMYLSTLASSGHSDWKRKIAQDAEHLLKTRPTAINLSWAVYRQLEQILASSDVSEAQEKARDEAQAVADGDADACAKIGEYGISIIEDLIKQKGDGPINILTHCNAGWLAFVDHGSATAPIYAAHDKGISVHVWVDETRPRNQGARLTAWELGEHGVPYTIIADNTGGHLMQQGLVDLVITGTDRTTAHGDVANKIGTYLKALAAKDNGIPFYVALPSSSFDWNLQHGNHIPIEQRGSEEIQYMRGMHDNQIKEILITPADSPVANYAFDVTPARLVTGLITERGICEANEASIKQLFGDLVPD